MERNVPPAENSLVLDAVGGTPSGSKFDRNLTHATPMIFSLLSPIRAGRIRGWRSRLQSAPQRFGRGPLAYQATPMRNLEEKPTFLNF